MTGGRIGTALARLLALLTLSSWALAHEVRPAYLEISEQASGSYDVLWKQPKMGQLVLRLTPRLSNGLIDLPPDQQYANDNWIIRRWANRRCVLDCFADATVRIEGLEQSLTGALVFIDLAKGEPVSAILTPAKPFIAVARRDSAKRVVAGYFTLGIEHILTGFDHLAFVLGLLLLVPGRRQLAATITAFTLAHSVTLAATALGYIQLDAPLIESLVALSIVFIGCELTRHWRGQESITVKRPWIVAFCFGLLHGCAFAGAIKEMGLPETNIPAALLLFNLGVEVGQLLFIAAVLGLVRLCDRQWHASAHWVRRFASLGIGVLGAHWMIERFVAIFG